MSEGAVAVVAEIGDYLGVHQAAGMETGTSKDTHSSMETLVRIFLHMKNEICRSSVCTEERCSR